MSSTTYQLSGEDIISLLSIKGEQLRDLFEAEQVTAPLHHQLMTLINEMQILGGLLGAHIVEETDEEDEAAQ